MKGTLHDPQVSKNIIDSKKNNFFVAEYKLSYSSDPSIIVKEAWMEKTWFNEIRNGKTVKVPNNFCSLYFKLEQTPNLKFRKDNVQSWLMEYNKTGYYVGLRYGIYSIWFPDCKVQDSVVFDLILTPSSQKQIKVGKLVFIPAEKM